VNLFAKFFQGVYVSEGEPVSLPTLDTFSDEEHESHKVSPAQVASKWGGHFGAGSETWWHFAILTKEIGLCGQGSADAFVQSVLSTCIFPAAWRKSYVVSIFKSGENWDIFCYNGISILSVIAVCEKMICDEITPIIRPQISVMQHDFMEGRFTVTNLVEFFNFVIDKIENGHQVDGIFKGLSPREPWLVVFRLDEEFLGDDACLVLVLFYWPHSGRQAWWFLVGRDLLPFRSASRQLSSAFVLH
jgi:hypothetical protein